MNKKQFLILMLGIAFFVTKTGFAVPPKKVPTLQELAKKSLIDPYFKDIEQKANVANFDIYQYINTKLPVATNPELNKARMDVIFKVLLFSDKYSVKEKRDLIEKIKQDKAKYESFDMGTDWQKYDNMLNVLKEWFEGFQPAEKITIYSKNLTGNENLLHTVVFGMGSGEETFGLKSYNKNILDVAFELNPTLEIKIPDYFGNTLLHLAASQGNISLVRELINRGADVNARNNNRDTPLHYAITAIISPKIKNQMVDLLLQKGANPRKANNRAATPRDLLEDQDRTKEIENIEKALIAAEKKFPIPPII